MADLITLDEYKKFASIEGNKTNNQITELIKAASKIVQDFIGYPLTATGSTSTYVRTRTGETRYMLPAMDMTVTELKYIPKGTAEASGIAITAADFEVSETGLLELYSVTPKNGDRLKVTYTAAATDMESIKLATMLLTKYYYKEEFNKTAMGMGGQTVTYQSGKNFPPQVRAILMMYRMH